MCKVATLISRMIPFLRYISCQYRACTGPMLDVWNIEWSVARSLDMQNHLNRATRLAEVMAFCLLTTPTFLRRAMKFGPYLLYSIMDFK